MDCEGYTPLFHWLASAFSFSNHAFFYFNVILFGGLLPLILFFISKKATSVWLYYSSTSFFYYHIDGVFPQGIAILLLLIVLSLKDWRKQLLFVPLGILAHSHGVYVVLIGILASNIWRIHKKFGWKNILLGCSGVFGNNRPEILAEKITYPDLSGGTQVLGSGSYPIEWGILLSLFTKFFPLPFWYFAIKTYLKKRRLDLLIVAGFSLVAGVAMNHRMFYVIPLVLIPGVSWYFEKLSLKKKVLFLLFTVLLFGFQLYSWFNSRWSC